MFARFGLPSDKIRDTYLYIQAKHIYKERETKREREIEKEKKRHEITGNLLANLCVRVDCKLCFDLHI